MKTATDVNEMFVCICSCETQWATVHYGTEGFGAFLSFSLDSLRSHHCAQ